MDMRDRCTQTKARFLDLFTNKQTGERMVPVISAGGLLANCRNELDCLGIVAEVSLGHESNKNLARG